jgi:hypothetical protein
VGFAELKRVGLGYQQVILAKGPDGLRGAQPPKHAQAIEQSPLSLCGGAGGP